MTVKNEYNKELKLWQNQFVQQACFSIDDLSIISYGIEDYLFAKAYHRVKKGTFSGVTLSLRSTSVNNPNDHNL